MLVEGIYRVYDFNNKKTSAFAHLSNRVNFNEFSHTTS